MIIQLVLIGMVFTLTCALLEYQEYIGRKQGKWKSATHRLI